MDLAVAVPAIAAAYLFGSTPFGLLVGRWARGIDVREAGSGNIGATNVARVLGAKWGAAVLALDALKGLLSTLLPLLLRPDLPHLPVLCGVAAVLGHMYPIWLGFRGGKGVATALGVIIVLGPIGSLVAFCVFAAFILLTRIVSMASIAASFAFTVAEFFYLAPEPFSQQNWSRAVFSLVVPVLITIRHRANIGRLLRGEEPRFQLRKRDAT